MRADAPFFRLEYEVLDKAVIGLLWAGMENRKGGKPVIGTAELGLSTSGTPWQLGRRQQQILGWWGVIPDFIITLDAEWCRAADDASFCALVGHELRHCDAQRDEDGEPKENRDGDLLWRMVPHDHELFISDVEDFGVDATGTERLFRAMAEGPRFGRAELRIACGSCAAKR